MSLKKLLVILYMLVLDCKTTKAQISDGLYNCQFVLMHVWDNFILVKGDTAYVQDLSEIKSQIAYGPFDTLIRENDTKYVGAKYLLVKERGITYLVVRKRKEKNNKYYRLSTADQAIIQKWHRRHNMLAVKKLYEPYIKRLRTYENDSLRHEELIEAYMTLVRKVDTTQAAFNIELERFKKDYEIVQ